MLAFHLGVVQVSPGGQRFHHVHHHRPGSREDARPLCRVAVDHLVRVHPLRQGGHAQVGLQAGFLAQQTARVEGQLGAVVHRLAGQLQTAQGGLFAGGIGVQGQDDPAGKALEQLELVLGQGSAHRRDRVGKTALVQGDHIQVALDDHHLVLGADRPCGPGPARTAGGLYQTARSEAS